MEALKVALREILCASLSLDDGLSAIQNFAIGSQEHADIYFDVARSLEEILLRRPGLASAKLIELIVRLSFSEDRILPEMLMLIDTRYTSIARRAENELLPDIDALPPLLDILGELSLGISTTIKLNLRPLLPFLADEVLLTLEAIHTRDHPASIRLAVSESHYLSSILAEAGMFDCSEAILNRLMEIAKELSMDNELFEFSLDAASVLTELRLYTKSREILEQLVENPITKNDPVNLSSVALQLAINETRDDSIDHETARKLGDNAAKLFEGILDSDETSHDGLGLALLVIGSSVLANGWREAVPHALERLEAALEVFEGIENRTPTQTRLLFKCLTGLGFTYGLMRDHDNLTLSTDFLERAKAVISEDNTSKIDNRLDIARCNHAIGWICLGSDSDEYWSTGITAFEEAIKERETLYQLGRVSELELIGSKMGLALSKMRDSVRSKAEIDESIHNILIQYVPLFPTDSRAFTEIAVATYNIVWLVFRHGGILPPRLLRFLDDIDRMLTDARVPEDSIFIQGVSLVVPYLNESWAQLRKRSLHITQEASELNRSAQIITALATTKLNLQAINLEAGVNAQEPLTEQIMEIDPLLAQYWRGQTSLVETLRYYYENKDYSVLASGLHLTAYTLGQVENIETDFTESSAFIRATSVSLARILKRFAQALESQFGAYIEQSEFMNEPIVSDNEEIEFLLAEDWLGLLKITEAYLKMVETAEMDQAKPYLNAVFSNVSRTLRMMDNVSLVDRRVLAQLGEEMNSQFYLRF